MILVLQVAHLIFIYSVFVFVHPLSPVFHVPVWVGRLTSSCPGLPGPLYRFLRRVGELILTPSQSKLFSNIPRADFLLNSSWGSGIAFLPRDLEYTELASATDQMKLNFHVGHHFFCQTLSRPIWSCLLLFTSSTQCLMWLWLERYPLYSTFRCG